MQMSDPTRAVARVRELELEYFMRSEGKITFPKPTAPITLSIVMLLYNRAELTFACLKSLAQDFDPSWELILVDNASIDRTQELLKRVEGAVILSNKENLQFIAGSNEGAKLARGETLLFLNNDTEVLPTAISSALKTLKRDSRYGIVTCKTLRFDGRLLDSGMMLSNFGNAYSYGRDADPFHAMFMFEREVDYSSGVFLMTPKDLFMELGMFSEEYAPAYYEDTDYSMKVRQKGLKIILDPFSMIFHHIGASSTQSDRVTKLTFKNRSRFISKYPEFLKNKLTDSATIRELCARHLDPKMETVLFISDGLDKDKAGWIQSQIDQGKHVTWYPLQNVEMSYEQLYQWAPKQVEVMLGYGLSGLYSFINERRRYFSEVVLVGAHCLRVFHQTMQNIQGFSTQAKIILIEDLELVKPEIEVASRIAHLTLAPEVFSKSAPTQAV